MIISMQVVIDQTAAVKMSNKNMKSYQYNERKQYRLPWQFGAIEYHGLDSRWAQCCLCFRSTAAIVDHTQA